MKLRDYQEECLKEVVRYFSGNDREKTNRQLIALPTGTGKTVVFAQLSTPKMMRPESKLLVLVHRDELVKQAVDKISKVHGDKLEFEGGVSIGVEKAENRASLEDKVVVASVQSLSRETRLLRFPQDHFKIIVIDEAHHATAPSYRKIIDYFGLGKKDQSDRLLLGVTATPSRSDGTDLNEVFDEIVFRKTIGDMIEKGWLVRIRGFCVQTGIDISKVKTVRGDFAQGELQNAVDIEPRNDLIVKAYEKIANGESGIAFCAGVEHAQRLASAFKYRGIESEAVWGDMEYEDRVRVLKGLSNGTIKIVTNFGVLTEGFDEPRVSVLLMARPTKSVLLYTQMVGRGTRLYGTENYLDGFGDKEFLKVIDVTDNSEKHDVAGLGDLFGIGSIDLGGKDVLSAKNRIDSLRLRFPGLNPNDYKSLDEIEELVLNIKEVNLLQPKISDEVLAVSDFAWVSTGIDQYRLSLPGYDNLQVMRDLLDRWICVLHRTMYDESMPEDLRSFEHVRGWEDVQLCPPTLSFGAAIASGDKWVSKHRSSARKIVDVNAPWRDNPVSPKQIEYLRKLGFETLPEGLTMGQAGVLIESRKSQMESEPASNKQMYFLRMRGISIPSSGLSRKQASLMISKLKNA